MPAEEQKTLKLNPSDKNPAKTPADDGRVEASPVVLLYHEVRDRDDHFVDGAAIERHILFLKEHFDMIGIVDSMSGRPRSVKRPVMLRFDDGYQNNAVEVAPVLRRHGVRATFFVCGPHATELSSAAAIRSTLLVVSPESLTKLR